LEGFTIYNSKMLIIKHLPNLSSRTTGAAIPMSRTFRHQSELATHRRCAPSSCRLIRTTWG